MAVVPHQNFLRIQRTTELSMDQKTSVDTYRASTATLRTSVVVFAGLSCVNVYGICTNHNWLITTILVGSLAIFLCLLKSSVDYLRLGVEFVLDEDSLTIRYGSRVTQIQLAEIDSFAFSYVGA
jgi:hypothetical protein